VGVSSAIRKLARSGLVGSMSFGTAWLEMPHRTIGRKTSHLLMKVLNDKGRYRQKRTIAISKPQPRLQNPCVRRSRSRIFLRRHGISIFPKVVDVNVVYRSLPGLARPQEVSGSMAGDGLKWTPLGNALLVARFAAGTYLSPSSAPQANPTAASSKRLQETTQDVPH
jgi:hypothetical protein